MTRKSIVRIVREAVLTVGAVVGVVCIMFTIASVLIGVRPVVVQSGSMEPTVGAGDLALVEDVPATELAERDIVIVESSRGRRIMHRVVDLSLDGQRAELTLQGDANESVDTERYTVTSTARMVGHVPWIGHVVSFVSSGPGLFFLCVYGALIALSLVAGRMPRNPTPRRRADRQRSIPVAGIAAVAALGSLVVGRPDGAFAAWTDPVQVRGGPLATATLAAPVSISCSAAGGLLSSYVDLSWVASTPGARHRLTVSTGGGAQLPLTPDSAPGVTTRRVTAGQVADLLALGGTVTVRLYATSGTNWISTGFATRTIRRTSVAGLGLDIRCS